MAASAVQDVRDDLLAIARLFLADRGPVQSPAHAGDEVSETAQLIDLCAAVIRKADAALDKAAALRGQRDQRSPAHDDRSRTSDEVSDLETEMRAYRAAAFLLMRQLNPDQAWFWTEEWQAGEREADAAIAAGDLTYFASDEEFDAHLRELRPDLADV